MSWQAQFNTGFTGGWKEAPERTTFWLCVFPWMEVEEDLVFFNSLTELIFKWLLNL